MKKVLENLEYKIPTLIFSTSEFNLMHRCLLYYPALNILYTYIPKNGCSTFKYTLGIKSGLITRKQNPHQSEHFFRYSNKMNFFPKNCENIICFRNPFERVLSAYLDKFARLNPEPEALPVVEKVHKLTQNTTKEKSISFIEFLRFLNETPNRSLDAHWRPQTDFIFFDNYTKVFLLENISTEWPEYFENIPLLDFTIHSTSKKYKTDQKSYHLNGEQLAIDNKSKGFPCINSFISDEIIFLFERRFSDDIKLYENLSGKKVFDSFQLLPNMEYANKQIQVGQDSTKQFTKGTAANSVETTISNINFNAQTKQTSAKPEVSVVIPTYNGGDLFKTVLNKVLAQKTHWKYEIIVIDSSSQDGTAEFLLSQSGIITHTIPKADFQHGKTRNLGVEIAQGDYIAFITQDALPTSEYWLTSLISSLKEHPLAAGVFGKHIPWDNASPFVKRNLNLHFKTFDNRPLCVSKFSNLEKYECGDQGWHQFLRFYSDNNSAMRKDIWEKIPYPEIEFGEDQAWAKAIIDAGYEKVYSPHGSVYHSHNYGYKERFIRAYEEYTFFKNQFGLMIDITNFQVLTNEINALNLRDTIYTAASSEIFISEEQLQQQLLLNKAFVLGKYAAYIANSYELLEDKLIFLEKTLENNTNAQQ